MNRNKALLAAGLAAALGLVLLLVYQQRFEAVASGGTRIPVLVAVQDIALGEPIVREKLGQRTIPEAYFEADRHIRYADLQKVIGVRTSMALRANQSVMWTDLATNSEAKRDLSALVRAGMRAVTIRADGTSTFGGLIRPGDRVDVLVTMVRGNVEAEPVTMPLLQNVLVLAAGNDTGGESQQAQATTTANAPSANNGRPQGESIKQVTVSTTMDEAALLVFAQDRGKLSLVLRNPEDIAVVEGLPETTMTDVINARGRIHAQPQAPAAPPAPSGSAPRAIEAIHGTGNGAF